MDKALIVEMANHLAVSGLLDGTMTPVRKLFDTHDLVWAVWHDSNEPDGVGTLIVKGERVLQTIVAEHMVKEVAMTAVPCTCAEQAVALKELFGEPPALN